MQMPDERMIRVFESQAAWEHWLHLHFDTDGIWIRMYKKASGKPTVTYDEALEIALCYGWIDGQVKGYDSESYIQRFTPRRAKSNWSRINVGHAERLIAEGRMKPSGQKAIDAAIADGRWDRAYHSPSTTTIPKDFLDELAKHKKAAAFFKTLNKTNLYAIAYRLETAKKPETRVRRMKNIIEMLGREEKFY